MELRQLRYFAAICEAGSLTRAGARLHISQQSLSTMVAAMEAELGVQLLERSAKGVRVTAAGRVLGQRATSLLADADAAVRAAQAAGGLGAGTVSVRYGLDAEHLVKPIMAAIRDRHPELSLTGWTAPDVDNLHALRDGSADLAFAWALGPDADFNVLSIAEEECVAAVPDAHPLAGRDPLAVEALAGRDIVMFPRGAAPVLWDHMARHFQADGRLAPVMREAPVSGQGGMVDQAVRTGAVALVSAGLAASLAQPGIRFVPLEPALAVPLQLAWKTGVSPAGARVIATVEALAEGRPRTRPPASPSVS